MDKRDIDDVTGVETMGHEWDGIKELNNPLPRWWLWTFYATIVFSIGYMVYYPAIPLLEKATPGISGQTNRSALRQEMAKANDAKASILEQIATSSLETISKTDELARFAVAGGASAFKVYCSQCHGSGAQGGPGYPNLNDDDWLWGGSLDAIYTSIRHGIRNDESDEARFSQMPAFGSDGILQTSEIDLVVQYILQITGKEYEIDDARLGAGIFAENCASCHGNNATGDQEIGAPNLADAISLYGNTAKSLQAQIKQPQHGVMPPWDSRLSDETIKQLTIYVHSLGGGE